MRALSNPPHKRIAIQTLGVSVLGVVAKIAGAIKAIAIARIFGSSTELDAYLLAFLIPSFIADVFCGSLVPALVPSLVASHQHETEAPLRAQVQRKFITYAAIVGCLLMLAGAVPAANRSASPNVRLTATMLALMSPLVPLTALANVWRAALNGRHSFLIPALSIVVVPLTMIASVLAFGRTYGVLTLAWAAVAGFVAEVAILGAGMRRAHEELFPRPAGLPPLQRFFHEYGYLAAAAAVTAGSYFIGQSLAAALGEGSLSILNYGTRLVSVLLGVGPTALGVTVLPHFAAIAARRDGRTLRSLLNRILLGSVLVSMSIAVVLIAVSVPLIQMTLQHGAFNARDTIAVAVVQQMSLIQLPFAVCAMLLMRTLTALRSNRSVLPVSIAALTLNAILSYALSLSHGVAGIALAASISQGFVCFSLLWFVYRDDGRCFRLEYAA